MPRATGFLISAVLLIAALSGCEEDPVSIGDPCWNCYRPLDQPEDVIENLELSYNRREIERYAELLHPDFIFRFQPTDFQNVGAEFWNRTTDSLKTERLFNSPLVRRITLDLSNRTDPEPPVDPDPELVGAVFIRVFPLLEIEQTDGILWQVAGDIQDIYLIRGNGTETDSTRWYLLEWRDIAGSATGRFPSLSARTATWGSLKARF